MPANDDDDAQRAAASSALRVVIGVTAGCVSLTRGGQGQAVEHLVVAGRRSADRAGDDDGDHDEEDEQHEKPHQAPLSESDAWSVFCFAGALLAGGLLAGGLDALDDLLELEAEFFVLVGDE